LSEPLLQDTAGRLSLVLKPSASPPPVASPARRIVTAASFARRLARVNDEERLHQVIVDTLAKAVDAQQASIAVYDPEQHALVIRATHGYPAVLVRHLRFHPDSGIIGSVYRTQRPLCVDNIKNLPFAPVPRLRYRT